MYNPVAENVLGTIGTVLWCIQLIPQIIRNYRVKDCEGLPPLMLFLWAASGIPFSIYFLATDGSIPLRIQPQLFTFFCLISWIQTLYYPPVQMKRAKLIAITTTFVVVSIGLEVGFILWLRPLYRRGIHWPMLIIGIIASVLLAIGLIPPYFELAKRKGRVVGINFGFLFLDSSGALFSMLSIAFGNMDIMSMVLYAIVLGLEIGIAASHFIWWIRFGRLEKNDSDSSDIVLENDITALSSNKEDEKSSSFIPLNFIEDPSVSKKDLEEEHTRELQVEQAFKLFQNALLHQKKQDYIRSYKIYEELFRLDVISNHYTEEEYFIRGVQNGSQNTVFDELSILSPNIKSLRYLIFRNRGFLYFGILKTEDRTIIEELVEGKDSATEEEIKEKSNDLFYTMLDDLCVALLYNESDDKLLDTLYRVYIYIGSTRLARFTLEYSLSSHDESDDLAGLLPSNPTSKIRFDRILAQLHLKGSSKTDQGQEEDEDLKFLKPFKEEYIGMANKSKKKNITSIECGNKHGNITWYTVIDSINTHVKDVQDDLKVEDTHRPRLKFFEPYLLTEDSMDRVKLELEMEISTESVPVTNNVEKEVEVPVVQAEETEKKEVNQDKNPESDQPSETKVQRASKRLAKSDNTSNTNSTGEIPEIQLAKHHFLNISTFINEFITTLTPVFPGISIVDVTSNYLQEDKEVPLHVKDFITVLSDWNNDFPRSFLGTDSNGSKSKEITNDDNSKLLELLSKFGSNGKSIGSTTYTNINEVETMEKVGAIANKLNCQGLSYFRMKFEIIKHLLGDHMRSLILDTVWDEKLYTKFKEWIIQFEMFMYTGCTDLNLAISVFEILVDCSISLETQVKDIMSSKSKFNRANANVLCHELLKINDQITKWARLIEELLYSRAEEEMYVVIKCRFQWAQILKEKSQMVSWNENKSIKTKLQNLLKLIEKSQCKLSVTFPNYKNFLELTSEAIQNQLTMTSVLSIFWRILYVKPKGDNNEAIELLEDILMDSREPASTSGDAITSIKEFLKVSSVDMRLNLWRVLLSFYNNSNNSNMWERFMIGFHDCLHFLVNYLSNEYKTLDQSVRLNTLLKILGFYDDSLSLIITNLKKYNWELGILNDMDFSVLFKFFEIGLLFETHEQATYITSLRTSIKEKSISSYEKLKDTFIKTIVLMISLFKNSFEEDDQVLLTTLIRLFHKQLGASGICDGANGWFLEICHDYLSHLPECDEDISQIIFCRYHYKINIEGFNPVDHYTKRKSELEKVDCQELAKFVIPYYFKKNPIIHPPKHEIKQLIDEMYTVIGDPDFDSNEVLYRNNASLEYFLESTKLSPRFFRDSFYGLINLRIDKPNTESPITNDLYYLQGLSIFSSYKLRKKNMQGRAVELENVIQLLTFDLIYGNNRIESWFLLGQAYGFLVEDDLIWTADKLTVPDRKITTGNLQRRSIICYLMAINRSGDSDSTGVKQIVGQLMSCFAKEMFSACMNPMDMHAFKVQTHPKFIRKVSGASFVNVSDSAIVTMKFCCKIVQQSLQLAIKSNNKDWSDYYYMAKVQRKLQKGHNLVLKTMKKSCQIAFELSKSQDCIVEPHYALVSLVIKYFKQDLIDIKQAMGYLNQDPIIQLGIDSCDSREDFYKHVITALRKLDEFDKKNWQHKPKFRIGKILYQEFQDINGAIEEMSNFVSLKATNKSLISIWKPEHERPGKHFYYTFQYIQFYIELLNSKQDIISLITMLPKLRRSNSIMINLYVAWEGLCSSVCKLIRKSMDIGESFTFTETIINNLSYQSFTVNVKSFMELMNEKGIPRELEPHVCFLHALNDMKKYNNGFGPTSLIDDTIVGVYFKIYLYYFKDMMETSSSGSTMDSPGAKKKIAKRDIFPLTNDIVKQFKNEIDTILKNRPEIYNEAIVQATAREKEQPEVISVTEEETSKREETPNEQGKLASVEEVSPESKQPEKHYIEVDDIEEPATKKTKTDEEQPTTIEINE
ncbi:Histone transcription regulator 3 [Spathaspora sp. JA1]|nr:Histone transcription regulator 3 [Spathaspora sp. JA1]